MPAETNPQASGNVILEWESLSRPFKPHTKEFYKTAAALIFLLSVILIFIGEFLLIGVIVALFFLMYVLSTVPPEKIKHRVTNLGIETNGSFHKWEEMHEFWFDEKYDQKMLVVHMLLSFPTHLQILLGEMSEEKLIAAMSEKVPFKQEPERTFLDQASDWLGKKIPLERTS